MTGTRSALRRFAVASPITSAHRVAASRLTRNAKSPQRAALSMRPKQECAASPEIQYRYRQSASVHWAADVIYTPVDTEFIKAAAAKGCRVLSGGGMCVHQAVEAFRLFTGITPTLPNFIEFSRRLTKRVRRLLSRPADRMPLYQVLRKDLTFRHSGSGVRPMRLGEPAERLTLCPARNAANRSSRCAVVLATDVISASIS